jgi:hypothetical protein
MATLASDSGSALFDPATLAALQGILGGTVDVDQTGSTSQNNTSNQSTTGNTSANTATTGTNNQTTGSSQSTTGTTNTTGTQSTTGTQTTQNTADIAQLMQVFQQQQQGVTPDMLAAIFSEGAKAAPGLVNATANAVGARSSNNTPLATALTGLNSSLVSKAAELSMAQRNASADTAAKIAQLTSGQTSTSTQNASTAQTQQTQQLMDILQTVLGNTTQNQTSNQSQTGTTNTATTGSTSETSNKQQDTQPNYGNIGNALALLLAGSGANSVLNGANLGGLSGLLGSTNSGLNNIGKLLGNLLGIPAAGVISNPGTIPAEDISGSDGSGLGTYDPSQSLEDLLGGQTGDDLLAQLGITDEVLAGLSEADFDLDALMDSDTSWWADEDWASLFGDEDWGP